MFSEIMPITLPIENIKTETFDLTCDSGGLIKLSHPERKIVAIEVDQNVRISAVCKLNALTGEPNGFMVFNFQGSSNPYTIITATTGTRITGKYWYFE